MKNIDAKCLDAGFTRKQCTNTMILSQVAPKKLSPLSVPPETATLTASDGTKLGDVLAKKVTVYRHQWKQSYQSILFKEVHSGVMYRDGKHVWMYTKHLGYKGKHGCKQAGSYAYGGTITILTCTKNSPEEYSEALYMTDRFEASGVVSGSPFSSVHYQSVRLSYDGKLTGKAK